MIDSKGFERELNGEQVYIKTLKNAKGTEIWVTNFGARVVTWLFNNIDIVVGFDNLDGYLNSTEYYFGATIGRYGNRIRNGSFSLNGKTYTLAKNNGPNHLHGGPAGFHNVVWTIKESSEKNIHLSYLSKDGEEGYPGNLLVDLIYTLTEDNELVIEYKATTEEGTILNLTNHSYFNLNGIGSGSILQHKLQVVANEITPVDDTLIPTGELMKVDGTAFDFREGKTIGENIDNPETQINYGKGYDHNYVLDKEENAFVLSARAEGDISGIKLEVYTDQPGMQFYSGNFSKGENIIKYGYRDEFRTSFCLETQHFPDTPNQPSFPSTLLEPRAAILF